MSITYCFLSCKLATSFQVSQFSFFQAKKVNHGEDHVTLQDIEYQLPKNILHHFLDYSFL